MSQHFPWILIVIMLTSKFVKADFCPETDSAGDCFENKVIPMAVASTIAGIAFSIFASVLSLCLFCKTRNRMKANRDKIWVAKKERSNWVDDCQDFGIVNRARTETRPVEVVVRNQTVPRERNDPIPVPSNCSDIIDAIDLLEEEDINYRHHTLPAAYYEPEQNDPRQLPPEDYWNIANDELYYNDMRKASPTKDAFPRREKSGKIQYNVGYASSEEGY